MLTREQNERLTRIGPGTPMGGLLRRYWHPIATSAEMARQATKVVRILGEELVLYADRAGRLGLVGRYCAHRRADLVYGIPDDLGLRCPYHGWCYDATGQCVEQPFEQTLHPDSRFKARVRLPGYPVEAVGGLIFAYLGPEPAPLLPRWDLLVQADSWREVGYTVTACNWLQAIENVLDPVHVEGLHTDFRNYAAERTGRLDHQRPRISHVKIAFDLADRGIIKRRLLAGETEDHDDWRIGHWLVFPNVQKGPDMMRFRVPVDDTHTAQWYYTCRPAPDGAPQAPADIPLYAMPSPVLDEREQPQWQFLDNDVDPQDNAIFVGQGAIYDRTQEMLGESDRGIILYRRLLEEQLALAERGQDPMNVFRDPTQNDCISLPTERFEHFLSETAAGPRRLGSTGRPPFSARYPSLLPDAPAAESAPAGRNGNGTATVAGLPGPGAGNGAR
jgi:5,5'-dehydrodivanillate O-demethylase oxygenase subunit